jgi:K+-transporting ATPase ATPase A chain
MSSNILVQVGLYLIALFLVTKPMGFWISKVMNGDCKLVNKFGGPIERLVYRILGTKPEIEMGWKQYAIALLIFNLVGVIFVYFIQRWQLWLPLNPQKFPAISIDSSLNTAISFVTNTNWQGYAGESTISYLTQMIALTVQNYLSAATGIAVVIALIRGFARHTSNTIGNFWVDMTRSTLYILLPLSFFFAIILMGQGVIQNFDSYKEVTTLQATNYSIANDAGKQETHSINIQTLAMGPVASQESIKMIGTNGGGFFNANSAHPFENPTPLANFLQMLAIFLIPAGLCFTFGLMVGDRRQGWAVFSAMLIVFVIMAGVEIWAEQVGNPVLTSSGADQTASVSLSGMALQSGGNMEGKETRFGIVSSALFSTITTAASCGAVNGMHDSLTPIGGLVPMWLIQLGEVIFGGVGSGLYTMLIYAVLAVFIAGLMIGRTPEYLGKKIEIFEMKMTAIIILITPLLVLVGSAIAVSLASGTAGIANPGAHGFSEILYALSSAANNNGSAFAGLSANTPFYNILLSFAMFFGRFGIILPVLAIAGSMASKKRIPVNLGTMPTHGPLFISLLIGAVILVGALTYVPALALGPVIEQLLMIGL